MVRANIKNSEDIYIGFIDENNNGFRIVLNSNLDHYSEYNPQQTRKESPMLEARLVFLLLALAPANALDEQARSGVRAHDFAGAFVASRASGAHVVGVTFGIVVR